MLRIGLTGGLASGKSTVAALFAARGAPVLDCDLIARELVEPGQPALAAIVARFGAGMLDAEGRLDRARLRTQVFANPAERTALEAILHPGIRAELRARLATLDAPYAILVIPLLVETGQRDLVDRVLVVDTPEATQVERAMRRDTASREAIGSILAAQVNRAQRRAAADDVIENSCDEQALVDKVRRLHLGYLGDHG
jgi:dephospho-CoA kinase